MRAMLWCNVGGKSPAEGREGFVWMVQPRTRTRPAALELLHAGVPLLKARDFML